MTAYGCKPKICHIHMVDLWQKQWWTKKKYRQKLKKSINKFKKKTEDSYTKFQENIITFIKDIMVIKKDSYKLTIK